jgi:hypothetical protein
VSDESDDITARLVRGGARGTQVIVEDLLGEAVLQAPIEFGPLRESGHVVYYVNDVEHPDFAAALQDALAQARAGTLRSFTAEARFSKVYAARQHEETTWVHPRGGKAKYLEDPLKEKAPRYQATLGRAIRSQLT